MSLDPSRMAANMFGILRGKGFKGPRLMDYCLAISEGSVMSIAGKSFATADVGTIPGAGVGTGTGLTAIQQGTVQGTTVSTAQGTKFKGPKLVDVADAFGQALIAECSQATLSSTHAPVFAGAGNIIPGSIPVVDAEWSGNIFNQGKAKRFIGPEWMNWCKALAAGGVAGFATATGVVAIAGAPAGIPVPGAGSGVGVIS